MVSTTKDKSTVTVRVETGMPEMPSGAILEVEHTKDVEKLLAAGRLIELDEKGDVIFREGTDPTGEPGVPAVPATVVTP